MTNNRLAQIGAALFLAAIQMGCAATGASSFSAGFESQSCVENALRRRPAAALADEAARAFEADCAAGDSAACSALGVQYELGIGRPQSLPRARALFARACADDNDRGCVNLAVLDLAGSPPAALAKHAQALLVRGCELDDSLACAAMGRRFARGEGVERDAARADGMLGQACDRGRPEACFELAELRGASVSATPLFARACAGGVAAACERLSPIATANW